MNQILSIRPPLPPPFFTKGNFDYIKCNLSKKMITIAYQAVNLLEYWDFMKEDIDSYMFSTDKKVKEIYDKIEELGYSGHSAFSFSWSLRNIQKIAKIGEEEFMNRYITAK